MQDESLFAFEALPSGPDQSLGFPAFLEPGQAVTVALAAQVQHTQWWPLERIRAAQLQQLQSLVQHAARTTRRGRKHFGQLADQPLTWERWRQVPITSRAALQGQPRKFLSNAVPKTHGPVGTVSTSGSTGRPVVVHRTAATSLIWRVMTARNNQWHRHDTHKVLGTVRHAPEAPPPRGRTATTWGAAAKLFGGTGGCEILHIGASTEQQLAWLQSRKVHYLLMYPSSLRDLLHLCEERGVTFPDLVAIKTFGEVLSPNLRALVREQWGLPIVDMYSTTEVGYIALQCPKHDHFHVVSEAVHVEVVREDGSACAVGEVGRLLVTPLHNYAMPLLRYDVGDLAVMGEPCDCGRGLPVLQRVLGRVRHTFVTADGARIWLTMGAHKFASLAPIVQYQFVQKKAGSLQARFVTKRPHTPAEADAILAHLNKKAPPGTDISIAWVDHIPRTARGKFLDFVSEL